MRSGAFAFIISVLLGVSISSQAGPISGASFFNSSTSGNWYRNGAVLDLDFANDRYLLNGTTYSGIANFISAASASFSRGSIATYYNGSGVLQTAASGVPRINYDPKTLAPRGLLIEESSTNVLQYSSSFSTSPWVVMAPITMTSAAATAPDGTTTAFLASASGSGLSYLNQNGLPSMASATYTRSIFAKAGTTSLIYFQFSDSTNCGNYCVVTFNLSTGASSWSGTHTGQGPLSVVALSGGWYRISATFTYSSAGSSDFVTYIGAYGAGTGSIYLWGAQLENKGFVTSYIPTPSSSAVTRSADSFSIPTSTWFVSSVGTLLASSYGQLNSNQIGYGRVVGGDGGSAFLSFHTANAIGASSFNGSGSAININTAAVYPTGTMTTVTKQALAWSDSTMTRSLAASSQNLGTSSYTGSYASANIYPGGSNYNPLGAEVLRITYFPSRLPDAYLNGMTL